MCLRVGRMRVLRACRVVAAPVQPRIKPRGGAHLTSRSPERWLSPWDLALCEWAELWLLGTGSLSWIGGTGVVESLGGKPEGMECTEYDGVGCDSSNEAQKGEDSAGETMSLPYWVARVEVESVGRR